MLTNNLSLFAKSAADCQAGSFFGFPTWYKYLEFNNDCTAGFKSLADTWLIVAAVIEMLLRLGALVAILFVLIGGIKFIMAQGQPEKVGQARSTAINGLIGLVITVAATAVVSYIAGKFN